MSKITKVRLSAKDARALYGVLTKPYERYFLRSDGVIVDNVGDIRYIPEDHEIIKGIQEVLELHQQGDNDIKATALHIWVKYIFKGV